jgi:DNA-binding PadR family transcriptional regulator
MLALREWSAYELTQQLGRSLDYCWPTAESVWYGEPKRLVRLARREPAATGRRARTVYAITGQGRQVLAAWLASEPAPPRLQIESMQDLLAAVRSMGAGGTIRCPQRGSGPRAPRSGGRRRQGRRRHVCIYSRRKYGPGMSTSECWALVAGQRRDLADAVADLPLSAWDTPSLCAGWRVRDVVAHVVGNAEGAFTARRALPGLLAHRFNVAAWLYDDGRPRRPRHWRGQSVRLGPPLRFLQAPNDAFDITMHTVF